MCTQLDRQSALHPRAHPNRLYAYLLTYIMFVVFVSASPFAFSIIYYINIIRDDTVSARGSHHANAICDHRCCTRKILRRMIIIIVIYVVYRREMFDGNLRRCEQRHGVTSRRQWRRRSYGHWRPIVDRKQREIVFRQRSGQRRLPVPVHTAHARVQGRLADMRRRPARWAHLRHRRRFEYSTPSCIIVYTGCPADIWQMI